VGCSSACRDEWTTLIRFTPEHGNTPYFYIFDLKILNHTLRCRLLTMAGGQWNAGELYPWLRPGTANSHLRMGGMEYSSIRSDLHPLQKKHLPKNE
jgi:hypothetical protein